MKNIFSQFGSKKVAGVVLAGATLVVGLGVVSNFSGGSQKAANEAALSRFAGDSAYNSFVGNSSTSRADLERQMSATQGGYKARFLQGKSDGTEPSDAFSSDGAYTEGVRSGSIGYGAENGEYQPFGSTYEQSAGGADFDANGGNSAYGQAQFQSVQDAAAAAANQGAKGASGKGGKGAKGQPSGAAGQVRSATQINKMAASNGGSTFGSSMGGGIRNGSGSYGTNNYVSGNDSNSVSLPQPKTGQADSKSFKFGRASGMGGSNVGFNGSEAKSGHNRGTGAASDLQMAVAYSAKANASKQNVGQKSLAEAAFDGSNPEDLATTIPEGASIDKVASSLMDRNALSDLPDTLKDEMESLKETINDTVQKSEELAALQSKLNWLMVGTALGALALSILIAVFKGTPWIAGIITIVAVAALVAMGIWMFNVIKQMQDPHFNDVNQGINWATKYGGVSFLLLLSSGLVAAGWSNMWQNSWKSVQAFFKGGAGAGTKGGFSFKAGKEAAKAVEGFKITDLLNISKWVKNLFPTEGK